MKLLISDCVEAGLCVKGVREWAFAHDFDFRAFARDGIDAESLAHIEDSLLQKALDRAREREEKAALDG